MIKLLVAVNGALWCLVDSAILCGRTFAKHLRLLRSCSSLESPASLLWSLSQSPGLK